MDKHNVFKKISDKLVDFFSKQNFKFQTGNKEIKNNDSKKLAKERLHIVLVQDRANISQDFLELMRQEIIDVIKKYVVVDENKIDVKFTNSVNPDGSNAAPSLYANIPILNIRREMKSSKIDKKTMERNLALEEQSGEALKKENQFDTMRIELTDENEYSNFKKKNKKNKRTSHVNSTKIQNEKNNHNFGETEEIKIVINKDDVKVDIKDE